MKVRTFGIGVIWTLIYMPVVGYMIDFVFGYTPFGPLFYHSSTGGVHILNPFEDWGTLYFAFMYDQWIIDTFSDFLLLLCFLLFIPVWALGWFWVLKIKWSKKLKFPFHFMYRQKIEIKQKIPLKKKELIRPPALAVGTFLSGKISAPVSGEREQDKSKETISSPVIPQPNAELSPEFIVSIKELGERFGFELFRNVQLDDFLIPLVLATDTKALLLKILLSDKEWIADETISEGSDKPTWFSSSGMETSPFFEVGQAAFSLAQKEPESKIIPVVVIVKGNIINAETMQKEWQSKEGYVVRYGEGLPESLMTLENLLEQEA